MYQCTASGCKNVAIFDMNICEDCFVKLSNASIANMGTPEKYICGQCAETFHSSCDFTKHLKPYGGYCKENE